MEFMSSKDASEKWIFLKGRVQILCSEGRVEGAIKVGMVWVIPANSNQPSDKCKKKG